MNKKMPVSCGLDHDSSFNSHSRSIDRYDGITVADTLDITGDTDINIKNTKTTVSSSDNVLNVYSGYVNVMIADNETHTITLPVKNGNNNTITYSADRDDNFPLNTA